MAIIVQKFGGTSVADIPKIKSISSIIKSEKSLGNKVVVVVSAMAGVTNHLVTMCSEVSSLNNDSQLAEYDTALCSGEMVVAALLALNLQEEGIPARSILSWQLPIITNDHHSKALVQQLPANLLTECLEQDIIPIIAGFQGVTDQNRLTSLGRGGSDTTAALVAASVSADRCDIYTDVTGVFTADPRIVPEAKKLDNITFEEMLDLASSGAKVLHPRCVEIALRYSVPIRVLSSFDSTSDNGTLITSRDNIMENRLITGITSNKNLLKILIHLSSINFAEFCQILVDHKIHIEMIQNIKQGKQYSLITQLSDKNKLDHLLENLKNSDKISEFTIDSKIAIVSIIGHGIKNDPTIVSSVLTKLEEENIQVETMQISEIRISILIKDTNTENTVRILHKAFQLNT
jgi:aspartate kinase